MTGNKSLTLEIWKRSVNRHLLRIMVFLLSPVVVLNSLEVQTN